MANGINLKDNKMPKVAMFKIIKTDSERNSSYILHHVDQHIKLGDSNVN